MHRQVEWMVPADVAILEFLAAARDVRGNPSIQSPSTIAPNTGYSRKHVGNRCRTLADRELLERIEQGKYRLSKKGEGLLNGSVSTDDV